MYCFHHYVWGVGDHLTLNGVFAAPQQKKLQSPPLCFVPSSYRHMQRYFNPGLLFHTLQYLFYLYLCLKHISKPQSPIITLCLSCYLRIAMYLTACMLPRRILVISLFSRVLDKKSYFHKHHQHSMSSSSPHSLLPQKISSIRHIPSKPQSRRN